MRKRFTTTVLAAVFTLGLATTAFADRVPIPNQSYSPGRGTPKNVYVNTIDSNYFQYYNSRFGVSGYVPSNFYLAYLPANGDGCIFKDGQGGELTISGSHNTMNETVYDAYRRAVRYHNPSYHVAGDNWYVISYEQDGYIYYKKTYINSRYEKTMYYKYPSYNSDHYEAYLPTLVSHFKP